MSGHLAATWRAHLTPRIGQRRHTHIYIHSFTKKECIDRYVYIYVCIASSWNQNGAKMLGLGATLLSFFFCFHGALTKNQNIQRNRQRRYEHIYIYMYIIQKENVYIYIYVYGARLKLK